MHDIEERVQAIRVGIADDHPVVRRALRWYIEREPDMRVAGEASSGREAIDLVRNLPVDVLLLDVHMPGHSGIDALTMVKAKSQQGSLGVLMISAYPEHLYAVPMIRKGASGYLSKSCQPEEIVMAVRCVASGRRWISPAVAELLANETLSPAAAEVAHEQLSTRELQLLTKLARGSSTREAADELSLSPKTVSALRARLLRKLAARSNSDLTYYAVKNRLIA